MNHPITIPQTICVDFDGTIVTHEFPAIGQPVPLAISTLQALISQGHKIILYTMRSGKYLDDAVNYLNSAGIQLFGINKNPTQYTWTMSPKAYAHLYIDDSAFGCPLIYPSGNQPPYVDWTKVAQKFEINPHA